MLLFNSFWAPPGSFLAPPPGSFWAPPGEIYSFSAKQTRLRVLIACTKLLMEHQSRAKVTHGSFSSVAVPSRRSPGGARGRSSSRKGNLLQFLIRLMGLSMAPLASSGLLLAPSWLLLAPSGLFLAPPGSSWVDCFHGQQPMRN